LIGFGRGVGFGGFSGPFFFSCEILGFGAIFFFLKKKKNY